MRHSHHKSGQTLFDYLLILAFFAATALGVWTAVTRGYEFWTAPSPPPPPLVHKVVAARLAPVESRYVQGRQLGVTIYYLVAEDGTVVEVSPGIYGTHDKGSEFASSAWRVR